MCVAVRTWQYVQKKKIHTGCQKQQPHRPFLRSRMPVRAWLYVRGRTCKKKNSTFKPRARNNNHTGRSFALTCPYVCGRTCKKTQKKPSNNHTGRSFALVNDDWIGTLCLSKNAHNKSRNYFNTVSHHYPEVVRARTECSHAFHELSLALK